MSNTNLKLELKQRQDKNGKVYFVAKLKGPFTIDASKGLVFLAFISENGSEELQIAQMDEKED